MLPDRLLDSTIKVFATHVEPNYSLPWQMRRQTSSTSTGFVIDGQLGWQGNFTDNGNYTVGLVGTASNVPVEVRNQTLNTAYYGVGVNWNVAEQIDLNFRWEGRSGDGVNSQMFTGGVTISF